VSDVSFWTHLFGARDRLPPEALDVLGRIAPLLPSAWKVAQLWPSRAERRALSSTRVVSPRMWDVGRPPRHTALVGSGLDLLSDARRLNDVLASCRLLLALERSPAKRDARAARPIASVHLGGLELHVYRGDLTEPLLRVDDYPTGVRPIRKDLRPLHAVLSRIDRAKIPFHLGIVPGILDEPMIAFLNGLEHIIASQHGFDHGYPTYSRILLESNDPNNQHGTVGAFDEFSGESYANQLERLKLGRDLLEARLGRAVRSYVPPTNTANRRTGRVLEVLGFEYVLSERPIPGCTLPSIPSGFYGRSAELPPGPVPDVLTLHATWEADLVERGDDSLGPFLAAVLAERERRRDEVERVVERIVSRLPSG
jgi:hypothetical protein